MIFFVFYVIGLLAGIIAVIIKKRRDNVSIRT